MILAFILIFLFVLAITIFGIRMGRVSRVVRHIDNFALINELTARKSFSESILIDFTRFRDSIANFLQKNEVMKNSWPSYELTLKRAGLLGMRPSQVIANKLLMGVVVSTFILIINYISFGLYYFYSGLIGYILGWLLIDQFYAFRKRRRLHSIDSNLINALSAMNSAFRSGNSIGQAVKIVNDELEGFVGEEFGFIYKDISLGLSVSEAFERFADRVPLEEVQLITSTISISSYLGGDITKVFESIEISILNRRRVIDEVNAITSTARSTGNIMIGIPFLLIVAIQFIMPDFFEPLFESDIGYLLIGAVILLDIFALIIMRRMMRIKL